MRASTRRTSATVGVLLAIVLVFAAGWPSSMAAERPGEGYSYATAGVTDHIHAGAIDWKILLNQSNLGGAELEMAEATFPSGMLSPNHTHATVEILYVLSGTYEHEVNGKRYRLSPGMVGVVRPGDHVRHIVPTSGPTKVLIIWAPASEPAFLKNVRGVAIPPLEPVGAPVSTP